MTAYLPGLLDRLMGQQPHPGRAGADQLKDNVARDLEALLNARAGMPPAAFDAYPLARASILNYGLTDFAAYCLSSSEDRAAICACLEDAIGRHEPRLRNVSAALEGEQGGVNRLSFVINATLHAGPGPGPGAEPVNFNAVLQPSSLNYVITKAGRPVRP
ncbi:type VI secretion system baseplate subunit TssE [Massilia luteola]|uniref:type VI secretion system baseplate subunit TssE n=1 Tax=Massilia luteola TaxID=3081751 RepID=UPI002ACC0C56|nr:type VI secretion system baseplate subunit TssE [Massilia sp. Gc5]